MYKYKNNISLLIILALIINIMAFNFISVSAENSSVLFDFENGDVNGFTVDNNAKLSSDTTMCFGGKSSLKVNMLSKGLYTLKVVIPKNLRKDDKVSYNLYIPADTDIVSIKPFYSIGEKTKPMLSMKNVVNDAWLPLTFSLSDDGITEFGVVINTLSSGSIFLDTFTVEKYNSLAPINMYTKTKLGGVGKWTWGAVEVESEYGPEPQYLDKGAPSIRIHVTGGGGYSFGLAPNNWSNYDFSQYYNSGTFEFDAAGVFGGETLRFCLSGTGSKYYALKIDEGYIIGDDTRPTKWQHFSIPLKDLLVDENDNGNQIRFEADNQKVEKNVFINDMKVISSNSERVLNAIAVNQVGYFPKMVKQAKVSAYSELIPNIVDGTKFNVKSYLDDSVVYTGKLKLLTEYDNLSGEKMLNADFTDVTTPGEYYIDVEGINDKSYKFKIGNNIYDKLLGDSVKYFYYQRSGMDITSKYAGKFAHKAFFIGDMSTSIANEMNIPFESSIKAGKPVYRKVPNLEKGWFDAGDFGKYLDNATGTIFSLYTAYECYPSLFTDNIGIPESGNGVPDLLDEVRWETDYFMAMQEETTGGFYHSIIDMNVNPFKPSEFGTFKRFICDVGPNGETRVTPTSTTANAVSTLSLTAFYFKKYDAEYSKKLLESAKKGWEYLKLNTKPTGVIGPAYGGVSDDKMGRVTAAISLFKATGEKEYADYVEDNYKQFIKKSGIPTKPNLNDLEGDVKALNSDFFGEVWVASAMAMPFYYYVSTEGAKPEVATIIKKSYADYEKALFNRAINTNWQNTSNGNLYWGSNSVLTNAGFQLDFFGNWFKTYSDDTKKSVINNMNYILGVNPLRFSFVAGYGTNRVRNIFSNIYMNDDVIDESPAGYMPGGVNRYNWKVSKFPGKCYSDGVNWTSNEHCLNYNGNLVSAVAAAIAAAKDIKSRMIELN